MTGLNINEKQIGIARQRAQERGLDRLTAFQFCDCSQHLPFPDASVDVIINIESACHYADRPRFIAECARVLRSGGRLVAQDWMAADGLSEADRKRYIAPLEAARFLHRLDNLSSYRGLLQGAGLRVTKAELIKDGIRPNGYIMRMGYRTVTECGQRQTLTDYEIANRERFRTFSESLLGGSLKVGYYVAEKPRPSPRRVDAAGGMNGGGGALGGT